MSDGALSETALLTSLRDIRLPEDAPGGVVAEIAVAVGMAGLCAIGLVLLLRLFSRQRVPARQPSLQDHLSTLAQQSDADRRVGLLHVLRTHAPERYAELQPDLYRRDAVLTLDQLETEVARLV